MNVPEQIFMAVNSLALIGWVLLVFAPRWRWTSRLVLSGTIPLLLAGSYVVLLVSTFGQAEGGFGSLAEVQLLFRSEWSVLTGWIHYLAFDLFIGTWELRDAQARGIAHAWLIPCLLLTFLLGPVGLLAYFAMRWWRG
ncbi:MAG: ABA4-like family protein [Blastocatellia bacterium]|jgi:hypothetical protein